MAADDRRFVDETTPGLAAFGIAALIEGQMLTRMIHDGPKVEEWDEHQVDRLVARAEAFLAQVTEPAGGSAAPTPAPTRVAAALPEPDLTRGQRSLCQRYFDSFAGDPFDERWLPAPTRIVDMGRLSRHLGVSERRLYAVWPTASDMNHDLLVALLRRALDAAEEFASQAIDVGSSGEFSSFAALFTSAFDAAVRTTIRPGIASHFAGIQALVDPEVRASFAEVLGAWRVSLRTVLLAMLSMSMRYRRPGLSADDCVDTVLESSIGIQRIISLNPSLVDDLSSEVPAVCGAVLYHVGCSVSTLERPPALRAAPAPVLSNSQVEVEGGGPDVVAPPA